MFGSEGSGSHAVVVIGAAGGIGRAVCERLASDGCVVIAADRTLEQCVDLVASISRVSGGEHLPLGMDFEDAASLTSALSAIRGAGIRVTGLVVVSGVALDALFAMVTSQSLYDSMHVNLIVPLQVTQVVVKLMRRAGGGSVVFISSTTAYDGNVGQLAYGASKAALINATRTLSMELAGANIRVNAIAPGVINTPMTQGLGEDRLAKLAARAHMGRLGEANEVASVVSWFLSEQSSYVTGQTLRVDGCM